MFAPMMMPMQCGGMNPMMGMFGMFQMFQMLQMLMMLMGQGQGQGQCGCQGGYPQGYNNYLGNSFGMPGSGGNWNGYPSMPYGNNYGTPPYCGPESFGPVPYNGSGQGLAGLAASMNGRHFKPGQTKRCADFVSTMIEQSGMAPPGFRHQMSAAGLANYGTAVGRQDLKPGDVVFFGNTYRPGRYTHVGIYLGDGRFAHRPTANKPVRIDRLDSGYYSSHYTGARRLPAASSPGVAV